MRFPLPYSSLSSIYRGITGKSYDYIYQTKFISQETKDFNFPTLTWKICQTSIVFPYHTDYNDENLQLFLNFNLRVNQKEKTIEHIEKMTIQHVMKDVYHFSIYSEKIVNRNTRFKKSKIILNNKYKWLVSSDIHNLVL